MARRRPAPNAVPLFGDAQPPAGELVFVYDRRAFTHEAEGWINRDRERPAFARGRLFRNAKGQLAFRPEPGGPQVRGAMLEVAVGALPVLDFVATAGTALVRSVVDVSVNLRMGQAHTWTLGDDTGWRPVKQERR